MTTTEEIMALADAYVRGSVRRSTKLDAMLMESRAEQRAALLAAVKDALEQKQEPVVTKNAKGITLHVGWDALPVGAKLYAAPVEQRQEPVALSAPTEFQGDSIVVSRELLKRALSAISAAIFGTDTYRVSSRGDHASVVEREIKAALGTPQERNFCPRCGKRLGAGIHTCTPPMEKDVHNAYTIGEDRDEQLENARALIEKLQRRVNELEAGK